MTKNSDEDKRCPWCGNGLVNIHWLCREAASTTVDLETRYGFARIRWGATAKHFDEEWYGGSDDD